MIEVKDHYYKKAKHERYLARSVYKLKEIDGRYRLTRRGMKVLDIGCAPGSWSQYLLERIGRGRVFGVDIADTPKIKDERFSYIKGDILSIDNDDLRSAAGIVDLVVRDACPNTTGNKFMDAQRSIEIVRRVFDISDAVLKAGGSVVAKVLTGEDVAKFVREIKKKYQSVRMCKPNASRKESRENFIVALSRRVGS